MAISASVLQSQRFQQRFWSKVDCSGPEACWRWMAALNIYGYGVMGSGIKVYRASHIVWWLTRGEIAEGLCVLHRCDNPACINPAHLFLGTHRDNMRDRDEKGRVASGARHGSCTKPESTPRGERCVQAKLTEQDVREIRALHEVGMLGKDLAAKYGVGQMAISDIVNRKTWKHVTCGGRRESPRAP